MFKVLGMGGFPLCLGFGVFRVQGSGLRVWVRELLGLGLWSSALVGLFWVRLLAKGIGIVEMVPVAA